MRYSIEPKDRICLKGYGFMSFGKNLSNKYSQNIIDTTKKSAMNAIKNSITTSNSKNCRGNG